MCMQIANAAQACEHLPTTLAYEVPFHVEQSQFGSVEKKVNGFIFRHTFFNSILNRINAKEREIVCRTNECFKFGNDARRPFAEMFKLCEFLVKQVFVYYSHALLRYKSICLYFSGGSLQGYFWPAKNAKEAQRAQR